VKEGGERNHKGIDSKGILPVIGIICKESTKEGLKSLNGGEDVQRGEDSTGKCQTGEKPLGDLENH